MIVIKLWRSDSIWSWCVQETPTDKKKTTVIATGAHTSFSHAAVDAVEAHDAAVAGAEAARSLLGRGRK